MLLLRFFVDYETVIESNYHDMLTMNEASLLTMNHKRRLIFSSWLENNIICWYNIFKWCACHSSYLKGILQENILLIHVAIYVKTRLLSWAYNDIFMYTIKCTFVKIVSKLFTNRAVSKLQRKSYYRNNIITKATIHNHLSLSYLKFIEATKQGVG